MSGRRRTETPERRPGRLIAEVSLSSSPHSTESMPVEAEAAAEASDGQASEISEITTPSQSGLETAGEPPQPIAAEHANFSLPDGHQTTMPLLADTSLENAVAFIARTIGVEDYAVVLRCGNRQATRADMHGGRLIHVQVLDAVGQCPSCQEAILRRPEDASETMVEFPGCRHVYHIGCLAGICANSAGQPCAICRQAWQPAYTVALRNECEGRNVQWPMPEPIHNTIRASVPDYNGQRAFSAEDALPPPVPRHVVPLCCPRPMQGRMMPWSPVPVRSGTGSERGGIRDWIPQWT